MFELPKAQFLMIFSALVLIVAMARFCLSAETKFRYNKYVFIVFGLWALSLIFSTVFSIFPGLSFWGSYERFQGLYSHLAYLIMFIAFLNILKDEESQKIFLKFTIVIGAIASVHGILQQFGIGTFGEESMNMTIQRSFGTMGNPNFLAQFLIFPLWGSIYFVTQEKNKRSIYIIIAALIIAGIILTKSRSSILGIMVATGFLTIALLRIKKIYKYILLAGAIAAFALFVIFIATNMQSLMARFYIWKGTLSIIGDHWLIGSGLETFKAVFQKVQMKELMAVEEAYSVADRAHNGILDFWVTQGFLGMTIYLAVIVGIFHGIFKRIKNGNLMLWFLVASLMSVVVTNLFSFYVITDYLMLTAILAIILNNTVEFKMINLRKTILTTFITGMIFALSAVSIFWAAKGIYADTIYYRGLNKILNEKVQEGMQDIVDSINLNMQQSGAAISLVKILEAPEEGDGGKEFLVQADSILDKYSEITGKDFQYYFEKAKIAARAKEYDKAEEYYEKASALAPNQPLIIKEWGVMLYEKGDYKMAIEKIEDFLNIIPEFWKWKPTITDRNHKDQEKYRLFFKDKKDFWEIFKYLSDSYRKIGDTSMAEYYVKFIENKEKSE